MVLSYREEAGGDDPAHLPEDARLEPHHPLNVVREVLHT